MSELDRKIAEKVMGEERPEDPTEAWAGPVLVSESPGGGWRIWGGGMLKGSWKPAPFSTDLQYAMRAWHQYCSEFRNSGYAPPELIIRHNPEWQEPFVVGTGYSRFPTVKDSELLPAICNLLLALKEEK